MFIEKGGVILLTIYIGKLDYCINRMDNCINILGDCIKTLDNYTN